MHSIAAALFLPADRIHFFNDIAYKHPPFTHCPKNVQKYHMDGRCFCDPGISFDYDGYSVSSSHCLNFGVVGEEVKAWMCSLTVVPTADASLAVDCFMAYLTVHEGEWSAGSAFDPHPRTDIPKLPMV